MNTLTIANAAHTVGPGQPAGTPAAAAGPGVAELDFAELLGAGIGLSADPAQALELVDITSDKSTAASDAPALDPAALLDAIAAGKATIDPQQQLSAAQIALQPMPASLALIDPATAAKAADSATLPVVASDNALSPRTRTEGGDSMAHVGAPKTAAPQRTPDGRPDAEAGAAVTVPQTTAREPAGAPVFKAEIPEHRQEPASQLSAVGSTPTQVAAPTQSANAASVAAHVERLAQPFGSHGWNEGFSSRVVWMTRNNVQSAEIHLNPPDLGPIEVKLVVTGEQNRLPSASLQFSAANAATREAIESALPRLREMLLDNGIALGNTTVDARTAGNTSGSGDSRPSSHGSARPDPHAAEPAEPALQSRNGSPLRRGIGLLDTFA